MPLLLAHAERPGAVMFAPRSSLHFHAMPERDMAGDALYGIRRRPIRPGCILVHLAVDDNMVVVCAALPVAGTRWCQQSKLFREGTSKLNKGEEVFRELVVAGGEATEIFEPAEEALD